MKSSRRRFLKIAGISILGFSASSTIDLIASEHSGDNLKYETKENVKSLHAQHWGMVIDTRRITSSNDLVPIIEACNKIHNIPTELKNENHAVKWIWHEKFHNTFSDSKNEYLKEELKHKSLPVLCNHCEKPACVRVCPTKATFKRSSDGIVLMDFHRCIGCRFCMAACPFGARSFNFGDPRPFIKDKNNKFPTRMKGVVEKCNFCAERLAIGKMPACVEKSSNGILTFGDLEDPKSEIRELLKQNYTIRRKQALGTGPSVYYIV